MHKEGLITKPIKTFGRNTLYAVYDKNGNFLYNETEFNLPSAKCNEAIIRAQEPKVVPFSKEEKQEMSGGNPSKRIFTDQQVKEIRKLHKNKVTIKNIAAMYDAGETTVKSLLSGKTYKHVN